MVCVHTYSESACLSASNSKYMYIYYGCTNFMIQLE